MISRQDSSSQSQSINCHVFRFPWGCPISAAVLSLFDLSSFHLIQQSLKLLHQPSSSLVIDKRGAMTSWNGCGLEWHWEMGGDEKMVLTIFCSTHFLKL
jgi:hypothetical protein